MRDCHLQVSGPWPPYHFVHRLTRSAHAQQQPAAAVAFPAPAAAPVIPAGTQDQLVAMA